LIGESAFQNCTGLTSITLPASIFSIGDLAFQNCSGLKEIHIKRVIPPPTVGTNSFDGVNKETCTFFIPEGMYLNYWQVNGWPAFWCDFVKVVED